MVYYPIPLYEQDAYKIFYKDQTLVHTETLCNSVLSLPMHTEMDIETVRYIIENVKAFYH